MIEHKPHISIGLPVFNGEKYIGQTLDSILAQTYQDFELIISDNASTDKTKEICSDYVKKDNRIKYYRNEKNFGAPWNYNRVFKLSRGIYFKWAAYDDLIAPTYLEKCLDVLDNDPSIVLCHSKTGIIDENGILIGNYDDRTLTRISSTKPHERFGDLLGTRNSCWDIFGVIRSNIFKMTQLHGNYINADRNLLAEIGLFGRIYEIPEYLFFRRTHPMAYTNMYYTKPYIIRDHRNQMEWWTGVSGKNIYILPNCKNCLEFIRSVKRIRLKWSEKLLCYNEIGKWIFREGWELIKMDIKNLFQLWRVQLNSAHNS